MRKPIQRYKSFISFSKILMNSSILMISTLTISLRNSDKKMHNLKIQELFPSHLVNNLGNNNFYEEKGLLNNKYKMDKSWQIKESVKYLIKQRWIKMQEEIYKPTWNNSLIFTVYSKRWNKGKTNYKMTKISSWWETLNFWTKQLLIVKI